MKKSIIFYLSFGLIFIALAIPGVMLVLPFTLAAVALIALSDQHASTDPAEKDRPHDVRPRATDLRQAQATERSGRRHARLEQAEQERRDGQASPRDAGRSQARRDGCRVDGEREGENEEGDQLGLRLWSNATSESC